MEIAIQDADVGGTVDITGGHRAGALRVETECDCLFCVGTNHDVFEIENDVGDIFNDAADGVELVERVIKPNHGDRCAWHRGQEGTTERVSECVAKARLKWLDNELLAFAIAVGDDLAEYFH